MLLSSVDSISLRESSLPLNFFTLLLQFFIFALEVCVQKMNAEGKVTLGDQQAVYNDVSPWTSSSSPKIFCATLSAIACVSADAR